MANDRAFFAVQTLLRVSIPMERLREQRGVTRRDVLALLAVFGVPSQRWRRTPVKIRCRRTIASPSRTTWSGCSNTTIAQEWALAAPAFTTIPGISTSS